MHPLILSAGRGGRFLLDVLLPPQCLSCGVVVDRQGGLCGRCWIGLQHIGPPFCTLCGLPFAHEVPDPTLCGGCAARPPVFDRARAAFAYDEASRRLILPFKHADRTQAAPWFGRWLARAAGELAADADLVAPVPLHRWRLFRRRYNQAALIALALAREAGRPAIPDLLVRRRATKSQGRLSRAGRARNVAGAFAVNERRRAGLEGRRVLLVDDVLTTGATVEACADILKRAGAAAVDVATLARVVRTL